MSNIGKKRKHQDLVVSDYVTQDNCCKQCKKDMSNLSKYHVGEHVQSKACKSAPRKNQTIGYFFNKKTKQESTTETNTETQTNTRSSSSSSSSSSQINLSTDQSEQSGLNDTDMKRTTLQAAGEGTDVFIYPYHKYHHTHCTYLNNHMIYYI